MCFCFSEVKTLLREGEVNHEYLSLICPGSVHVAILFFFSL